MSRATASNAPQSVTLEDLLALDGVAFIRAAYELLLGRAPDPGGMAHYSVRLQSGTLKTQILYEISISDEFRRHSRSVDGLERLIRRHRRSSHPIARVMERMTRSAQRWLTRRNSEHAMHDRETDVRNIRVGSRVAIRPSDPHAAITRPAGASNKKLLTLPLLESRARLSGTTKRHAALTIISKNYLAYASTLARSYLDHHPEHDFIIALVDRADGMVPERLECGAEIIEIAAFQIPDLVGMIYRYSIMELNTAVKPFVLDDLFRRFGYETLLYIDPDILIFEPLSAVYNALSSAAIVLTPHMRRPFFDRGTPSDQGILQSGTYNLGFIGLRRSDAASRMLGWWMEKLHMDCRVELSNGLFVDQKWIDLVPGFFPEHAIIYHPGYNAAYWNLHERPISRSPTGQWLADDQALVFFHFSGYSPFAPDALSKHQSRHQLNELPELKALTDHYAKTLRANGFEQSTHWPYAFATLPNGVQLPLDLVAPATQWLARQGLAFPDPLSDPDGFCRLLMFRGLIAERPEAVLIFDILLMLRHDVAEAFQGCVQDHDHPGFRAWLMSSGTREHQLAALLSFEEPPTTGAVIEFFRLAALEPAGTVIDSAWWNDPQAFDAASELVSSAIDATEATRLTEAVRRAIPSLPRIVHLYFLRPDLQAAFGDLGQRESWQGFVSWLSGHRHNLGLSPDDIELFRVFAESAPSWLTQTCALYRQGLEGQRKTVEKKIVARGNSGRALSASFAPINLAGYLSAPTGMGESARSLQALLESIQAPVCSVTLPHEKSQQSCLTNSTAFFGWPASNARLSITVANADATEQAAAFLPDTFRGRRRIGFWVWETEELPRRYKKAQDAYDEIWTPSQYSARAIERTVDLPVKVLPHTLDFPGVATAHADRKRFGLPADMLLFGFAFDPMSVIERKNVLGLIETFQASFRKDDRCRLVLKINSMGRLDYDLHRALARAHDDRVLLLDQVLDRASTLSFLKSLDAYVSLHRAEGFGLTCAEAMACGVPVMATAYSGNLEFMSNQDSVLVPAKVIETDRPHGPYPAGTRWADPDRDAAQQGFRNLLSRERRDEIGASGAAAVTKTLSPGAIGEQLKKLVSSIDQ